MDQTPRSPQPPSHDPYGNPYTAPTYGPAEQANPYAAAFQHPPAAQPAARHGWAWKATIAGAVAGGVLAASVAVPVTWALNRSDSTATASAPSQSAPQVPGQTSPDTGSEGSEGSDGTGQVPDFGGQAPGYGQTDPYGQGTSTQEGTQTDATAEESKGVVLIDTVTTEGEGAGTGLVIDSSGLVLTNYHVVEGSTQVKVTVATTGETYDATVVGHDQTSDIALLQLDGASGLDTVTLDDDGDPAVSDAVTAIGNAQGQGYLSASSGSVVALDQSIDTAAEGTVEGEHLTGLIQMDAYVVGGYSGGALLDDEGEVVGITTAASSGGETESFAIPIDTAEQIVEQIESGDESGDVQVGPSAYLGIAIAQTADDTSGSVQVSQVQSGGAAADAGVTAGSTITAIGSTSITSYDVLKSTLATYEPGDSALLKWTDSSGKTHSATVTLGESPVN
ncbi:S1C family serine protease [Nocardioides mangrovi]|uniref:Trypsin-like peptidase domain-containing protein n=1 Tax=Nocardioides mangrovi TaxID=2874580 RepID=A0ABS7UEM6_9ACTN|nr:trypsin-like peptidase domain-containing protein [Nocardioides mangrovi]MBZ5739458.1 trypsin-like peptidase domain-containing protein [Nocardioides mangrovi]